MTEPIQIRKQGAGSRGQGGPRRLDVVEFASNAGLCSTSAERTMLAICLVDEGATLTRARRTGIGEKAFKDPLAAYVWGVACTIADAGQVVTLETVSEEVELQRRSGAQAEWCAVDVEEIAGLAATTAQAGYFIAKVLDLWRARIAQWHLVQAVERVREGAGDWKTSFAAIETVIGALGQLRPADGPQTGVERFDARTAWWERVKAGQLDKTRRVSFGLPKFDRQCGLLDADREHFLNIIGARASGGKSTLARAIVDAGLAKGQRFCIFLLETTCDYWLDLMAATRAGVSLNAVEEGPPDFLTRLAAKRAELRPHVDRELFLHENAFELDDIVTRARDLHRRLADAGGLHAIVIDYLQQVQVRRMEKAPREQQVAYISRQLHHLGKELHVPVIALAQLNRGSDKEERRPRKSDLRESGAIEQDADTITLLHIPKVDMRGVEQTENQQRIMAECLRVKSRNGPLGAFKLWFDRPLTRFVEMGEHEESAAVPIAGQGAGSREQERTWRPAPGAARGRGYGRSREEQDDGDYGR